MTVPTKLRRELSSSPSTLNLADFLEVIEAEGYDDTEVRADILTLSTAISNLTNTIDGRIEAKVKAEALIADSQPGE